MSRTLSTAAINSMMDQETDDALLCLITIEHDDLPSPMRFVDDKVNVTSNGLVYIGFPFAITLPDDDPDKVPEAKLEIGNTDRVIVEAVRSLSSAPLVTIQVVMASQPDTVEMTIPNMRLRMVEWDAAVVSGTLAYEDVLNEQIPGRAFSPDVCPGLF